MGRLGFLALYYSILHDVIQVNQLVGTSLTNPVIAL